jgi:hypothetical protein
MEALLSRLVSPGVNYRVPSEGALTVPGATPDGAGPPWRQTHLRS